MKRMPLQSSNLVSVGYDPATSTIEVEFHNGGVYQYYDVPSLVYKGLISAVSKGSYFHHHIKMKGYRYSKTG